ncbi:NAD(P)-dependent alcohol dehydrogenase [Pseudoneobacillus rhizosphaerae]|uniref:Phthiocerol synthesis polyketide synthase type I PpsC n=1 Tax=Pseudoneobacillus rhizosphaerae TaxID=2880968 RepID=A0A9C7GCY7_9BACI|nr:NAD(P)-dependent alcohol dehydrogenase [Pseudoneobacillus rhizosphaerae]CAG9610159.1 Phthiocerol synthesis polyketide synthase type I PpsC [Pseudoneobacillus rhizosphaerae]
MKAMVYNKYGMADVITLKEVEIPTPKENEVLVKIHSASVNSWDWDLLRGKPFLTRLGGLLKPKYKTLGADIAGEVKVIGRDVKHLLPGDEVFGDISWYGWGGFAEYVCVNEDALSLKPSSMTFDQAAAIPQAAVLALQGLLIKGELQKDQTVLINGAGGGVGTFALQIAKLYGAKVTCVDSTVKLDMLKTMGADHVIDYSKEELLKNGRCYDLILDVVGNRSIFDYKRLLNPAGAYVMVGGSLSLITQILFLGPLISKMEGKSMNILVHKPNKQDQNFLQELFVADKIRPVIDRTYSLSQVAEAFKYFGEGHAKGKVLICMDHKKL